MDGGAEDEQPDLNPILHEPAANAFLIITENLMEAQRQGESCANRLCFEV